MQKLIRLHPGVNSGEGVLAVINFEENDPSRALYLKLNLMAYGNHYSTININFDNPEDMLSFSNALREVAEKAIQIRGNDVQ